MTVIIREETEHEIIYTPIRDLTVAEAEEKLKTIPGAYIING